MNPTSAIPPRILIVEDDADAARQLENLLRAANFQLIGSVSTGQEALLLAESSRPDLVIMDIVLPGDLDGIQTATLLAERHDIPVLYLTAYSDEELYERARATLPLAYLSKPFDDRALQRAIALALDRHALLARLKASQAQLAEAQAVARMGSWYWNLADDRIDVSDELLRLLNLAPGSFEPRFDTFLHLACAADRPKMLATVETLLAGKDPGDVDIRLDRPDTALCVLRVRGSARFDAQGRAIALLGTTRDVTAEWRASNEAEAYRGRLETMVAERTAELSNTNAHLQAEIENRLRMEEALWRNEQRYRGLVDNLPEPILVMQDEQIVFANPALARLLGFPVTTAVLGMPLAELLHADSRQACEQCKQATFAGKVATAPTILMLRRADGGSAEVEALTFAFDYEGHPAILAVLRDLTARRVMEQVAERFRVALDSSPDAVYLIDPEAMRFLDINATALSVLGYSREELLRLGPQDIKPHFNKDMLRARFVAVMAGKPGAEIFQTVHQRKDGGTFPVEFRLSPFVSAGQSLIVAVARDVSERIRVEAELRETHARFQQLAGNIDEAFWIRDLVENRFLYANPAYEQLYGKNVDSLYRHPRSFLSSVHPDDRDRITAAYDAQSAQPSSLDLEYRVVIGEQVRWLWVRTFPIHDADGKVYRTIGLAQDVTHRRESEEQYRGIIQTSMDGFWWTDVQGRLLDCNEAYCRMMGYSREELLTLSVTSLEAKETAAETAEHIRRIRDQGYDRFESQHRHKDGHLIDVEISAYYRSDAQEGHFFCFLRDVTEHKRAEAALQESQADLNRAQSVGQIGSWRLDVRNDVLTWSEENHRIFEVLPGETMTYETFLATVHPADREYVDQEWKAGLRGEPYDIEHRLLVNGRVKWVRERAELEFGDQGELIGGFGTTQDITQRKRAEAEFKLISERLDLAVRAAHVGIWDWDIPNDKLTWDDAMYRIYGVTRAGFGGAYAAWEAGLHPDDLHRMGEAIRMALSGEQEYDAEFRVVWPDQSIHHVHGNAVVLRDAAGKPIRMIGTNWDITEHKQAEAALRQERDNAQRYLDTVQTLMVAVDNQARITMVNRKACEVLGYAESELVGRNWLETCLPKPIHAVVSPVLEQVVSGDLRAVEYFENPVLCRDGSQRLIAWHNASLTDAQGHIIGVLGSGEDITERRRSEQALIKSEERYRAVVEDQTEIICRLRADGSFTFVSDVFCRFFGKTAQEILGETWHPVAYSEDIPEIEAKLRTLAPSNPVVVIENRVYSGSGELRWMQFVNRAFFDSDGGIVEIQAVGRDISDRKQAELALRQSEERFRLLFEYAPIGIALADMEYKLIQVNRAMCDMLGYSAAELTRRTFVEITHPEDLELNLDLFHQAREERIPGYQMTKRYLHRDGSIVWINLISSLIRDQSGKPLYSLGMIENITERVNTEQQRLAHEANQREALVREVHHRIKNNLQGVIGLLRQHIADHPLTQAALEAAIAQINTIAVVHGLQSRMPQNELRLRELLHAVSGAAAALAMLPQRPPLDDALSGDVWLDSNASVSVALILNELIHNALKHNPHADGSGVVIGLSGDNQHATVRITNPGGPLPAGFDLASGKGCGTGLDLIRTLLPRRGATLKIFPRNNCIETEFVLGPPLTIESELTASPLVCTRTP